MLALVLGGREGRKGALYIALAPIVATVLTHDVAVDRSLRTWHAAFPNTSDIERRCLILSYTPFWHKPFGQVIDNGKRLMAAGKLTTPLLRQLFHVEGAGGGYGGTPENAAQHPRMDHV